MEMDKKYKKLLEKAPAEVLVVAEKLFENAVKHEKMVAEEWNEPMSDRIYRFYVDEKEGNWTIGDGLDRIGYLFFENNTWFYQACYGELKKLKHGFEEALGMASIFFVDA